MTVCVTEFTDPGCPWAWSAEPHRRRLQWLYGEGLGWQRRLVVLSRTPDDYAAKGFTTEMQASGSAKIAADHGMPIDVSLRPRMVATEPACAAVLAARLHAPDGEDALLRRLRIHHFAGDLIDEPPTIAAAAREAGLDPSELDRWTAGDDVRVALLDDFEAARAPMPAARALDHKLANWTGGQRYTCPSFEIRRTGEREVTIAIPGFQPLAVYDVVLANLCPQLDRRDDAESAEEVLQWAGEPLATQEVAAVRGISRDEARAELVEFAREDPLGTDSLWSLA